MAIGCRSASCENSTAGIFGTGLTFVLFAVLLSAVLTLPLMEFMSLSRRSGLSAVEAAIFSLSAGDLAGLVLPKLGVYYELIVYLGVVPLLLAVLGIGAQECFLDALVAVLAGLFALGPHTPFFPLVVRVVPLLGWLRVPSRVWFFGALAIAVLASYGADRLLGGEWDAWLRRWLPPGALGLSLAAVLLAGGMALALKPFPPGLVVLGIFLPIGLGVIALIFTAKLAPRTGLTMLTLLLVIDLMWAGSHQLSTAPLPPARPAESWLNAQDGLFRVYSPSDSLPFPSMLEQVNGVNPLHLDSMAQYIGEAAGYTTGSYSVSLPDIYIDAETALEIRQAAAHPDVDRLGLLNTRYLAAEFPLEAAGLKEARSFGSTIVYENLMAFPRAWMENGQVEALVWTPNHITLSAASNEGGRLVLSEVMYPGWMVSVDGRNVPMETAYGVLRGVTLPSGSHEVRFVFRPISLYLGAGITVMGWLALALCLRMKPRETQVETSD